MFEAGVLIISVLIGSFFGYFFISNQKLSKVLLIFSGAYFLATAILEIFPEIYETNDHKIGLYVLAGLFFQLIIESLSKGAEHGHVHFSKNRVFPMSIFIGLFLHSFFEGLPILHQENHNLLWAIFVHNIPVSMILFGAVSQIKSSALSRFGFMAAFAFAGPLGILFGESFLSDYHHEALAFVAGIFIHIATVILFESTDSHKFKAQKVLTVLLGFAVAYMVISLF